MKIGKIISVFFFMLFASIVCTNATLNISFRINYLNVLLLAIQLKRNKTKNRKRKIECKRMENSPHNIEFSSLLLCYRLSCKLTEVYRLNSSLSVVRIVNIFICSHAHMYYTHTIILFTLKCIRKF